MCSEGEVEGRSKPAKGMFQIKIRVIGGVIVVRRQPVQKEAESVMAVSDVLSSVYHNIKEDTRLCRMRMHRC